jgi:hypothetical protein
MILKLTEDNYLFSWLETDEERKWFYEENKTLPLNMIMVSNGHASEYSNEWYKEHLGGQLWFHLKK